MRKILFVCLGNICRSPVAEGICLHLIEKYHLKNIIIDSAGTANYHVGEQPDKRSCHNALKHGINISNLRARQIKLSDLDEFDEIYVMDNNNIKDIQLLSTNNLHQKKIKLLRSIIGEDEAVPDPYYGNEKDFETVFTLCEKTCIKLLGIGN
ncbi:MAG: low molecular weight phosphotyrosine protein phosphatase [Bacteroidetes bacterium]|nr:low molecular weight phosphotyrosine protein phosphatase [Bacteroidota bacterium]